MFSKDWVWSELGTNLSGPWAEVGQGRGGLSWGISAWLPSLERRNFLRCLCHPPTLPQESSAQGLLSNGDRSTCPLSLPFLGGACDPALYPTPWRWVWWAIFFFLQQSWCQAQGKLQPQSNISFFLRPIGGGCLPSEARPWAAGSR